MNEPLNFLKVKKQNNDTIVFLKNDLLKKKNANKCVNYFQFVFFQEDKFFNVLFYREKFPECF